MRYFKWVRSCAIGSVLLLVSTVGLAAGEQCSAGNLQCCSQFVSVSSAPASVLTILTLLGVPLGSVAGYIGVICSPISPANPTCETPILCCANNTFNGVVSLGCSLAMP